MCALWQANLYMETGLTGSDGKADVTLADGTHVRAAPAEIIAE